MQLYVSYMKLSDPSFFVVRNSQYINWIAICNYCKATRLVSSVCCKSEGA
jgi:hypothetical protein